MRITVPVATPSSLTIAGITVKTDSEGRFCLNDFHKAAGGEPRHTPNQWQRNQQTRELADELTADLQLAPVATIKGGATPGTYVVKELVYAYAMWVSPKFHLHVIRTYDQVAQEALREARAIAKPDFRISTLPRQRAATWSSVFRIQSSDVRTELSANSHLAPSGSCLQDVRHS